MHQCLEVTELLLTSTSESICIRSSLIMRNRFTEMPISRRPCEGALVYSDDMQYVPGFPGS